MEVQPNVALLAYDYPFLGVFWSMLVFFAWVIWFVLLFRIIMDIFSRHDIGGGGKTLWIIFVIILPFLGVFVYLIANNEGMTERAMAKAQAQQSQMDDYKAKGLLDSGAITQAEFDAIKQKALA